MGRKPEAEQYAAKVVKGKVVACELHRLACERFLADLDSQKSKGFIHRPEKAQKALDFSRLCRHSKGEWAGQVFIPSEWQAFQMWNVFGWYWDDGRRRFRTVYEEVPRKNGKSTKLAVVGNYLFLGDGEPGAEVYSAATKRDQAKIVHSEAVRMVKASRGLRRLVKIVQNNMSCESSNSKYEPLGADADSMDGLNPHAILIDELHAHKTRAMWDVLDTATGARREAIFWAITTAGTDRESVCFEQHEYAEKILKGVVEDDSYFAFIAAMDPGDPWDDRDVWRKANPNYGISVKPDDMELKARRARESPAALNAFLRLHLNVWTQQIDRWITPEMWAACQQDYSESDLKGPCWGGLDLGSVSDLTSFAMVFPHGEGYRTLVRTWCPEARLDARDNRYREQYRAWEREGWLRVTPGNATDYQFIKLQIMEDAERFELQDFAFDRWQAIHLTQEVELEGLTPVATGQGFANFAAPMKEAERLVLSRALYHNGNPVLRFAVHNTAVRQDPAGNLKPDKSQSQGKIDPFVAVIMGIDRASRQPAPSEPQIIVV